MNAGDVVTVVYGVGGVQLLASATGFGILIQTVRGHGDRITRLEDHEDQDRNAREVWTPQQRRRVTGHA
jgi:hypothetical protein